MLEDVEAIVCCFVDAVAKATEVKDDSQQVARCRRLTSNCMVQLAGLLANGYAKHIEVKVGKVRNSTEALAYAIACDPQNPHAYWGVSLWENHLSASGLRVGQFAEPLTDSDAEEAFQRYSGISR
jgi:hypothetical protein